MWQFYHTGSFSVVTFKKAVDNFKAVDFFRGVGGVGNKLTYSARLFTGHHDDVK